jgi:hypothetical protein
LIAFVNSNSWKISVKTRFVIGAAKIDNFYLLRALVILLYCPICNREQEEKRFAIVELQIQTHLPSGFGPVKSAGQEPGRAD